MAPVHMNSHDEFKRPVPGLRRRVPLSVGRRPASNNQRAQVAWLLNSASIDANLSKQHFCALFIANDFGRDASRLEIRIRVVELLPE